MALKRQFSVAPFLLSLTLLIFLEGVDVTSSTKDIFEKCCELGDSWAENKLRCEKFTGPVPGVEETELEACYETVDICCRKAYQRKSCDRGKADAKAGLSCVKNETGSNRSQNEQLADYQRDCCEGCKLGILTGSSGKGCAFKKISLGIPWDPAFEECCAEVITDTSKGTLSTVSTNGTTPTTSSSIVTSSESDELDDIFKEDTDFNPATSFNSDDLCQLMKGLLCSEICVPTPGSYYCKCQENSILQEDGRTCKSNLTSTQTPIVSLTTSTSTPNINSISDTSKFLSTDVDLSTSSDSSSSTKSTSELLNSTLSLISSSQKTTSKISLKSTSTIAQSTSAIVQNSTKHMSPIGTLKLLTLAKSRTTRSLSTENNELNLPCPLGYRYNPSSEVCDDVDECNGIENEKHAASCPPGSGCHDTKGRYRCTRSAQDRGLENRSCEPGYRWNSTLGQCLDIDECSENTHKCSSVTENCKNLEGSYICEIKCERGFIFNDDYGECLDINECIEMTNVCRQPDTICINTLGSFMCKSLREYQRLNEPSLGENGSNDRQMNYYESADDEDIDECQLHPQPCAPGELCRNIIGGYDCIPAGCPRGFALANDTCADVNECEQGLHSCAPHERCQNTNGSFTCETPRTTRRPSLTEAPLVICRKGYRADVASGRCLDIDECVEGPGCRDHERCHNLQGSYDCSPLCGPGWYFQIQTKTCQDVDECLLGHHNCRQRTQYCRNTNGSYVCEALSACPAGYRRAQNGSCIDVDECLESLHTCSRDLHRYCVNRDGGYECITRLPSCSRGFEYSLFTRQCEDVDECRRGTANCDANMNERCVNLPGGYRCERPQLELRIRWRRPACPVGHTYDVALRKCVDIDECTEGSHDCGNQKCYNLPGTYQCAQLPTPVIRRKTSTTPQESTRTTVNSGDNCSVGSRYDTSRGGGCVDVDECKELEDACSSNEDCVNSPGSFRCVCKTGFRRDELTQACVDINECQLENDCLSSQRCDNTIGSYACVRFLPCGTGYTLNAATEICEDDDECILGIHDCPPNYHCRNTLGSYRCDKDRGKTTTTSRPTTRRTLRPTYTTFRSSTTAKPTTTSTPKTTTTSRPRIITTTSPRTTYKPIITTTSPRTTYKPIITTTSPRTTYKPTINATSPRITYKPIINATSPRTTYKPIITTSSPTTTSTTKSTITTRIPNSTTTSTTTTTTSTTETIPTVGSLSPTIQYSKVTTAVRRSCPRGFESGPVGQCIDINECQRNSKMCGNMRCINTIGSYRCEPRILCAIGYAPDPVSGQCKDIDECLLGVHKCGPEQKCENRPGRYACYCPPGYEIGGNHDCIDVDECKRFSYICDNGRCFNTPGSYRCLCDPGFENDAGSVGCRDVDECVTNPGLCQQDCYNTIGSYRCGCLYGFRLKSDNRTCEDIDECAEFKSSNLCIGICDNTPGSYACRCPDGYLLGRDGRTCQDIDECATGNVCSSEELCQNVRGGYRCNKINCPPGYILDSNRKNRCVRESPFCPVRDQACFLRPAHYTYNYIAIVSMYPIPQSTGKVDVFTMRGTYELAGSTARFNIAFIKARAPPHVIPATESCFALHKPYPTHAVLVMTRSLQGPQDIELEFSMEIYGPTGAFAGSAVAKIFIIVTQYEF